MQYWAGLEIISKLDLVEADLKCLFKPYSHDTGFIITADSWTNTMSNFRLFTRYRIHFPPLFSSYGIANGIVWKNFS